MNQAGLIKFNEAVTRVVENGEASGIVALLDNGSESHVVTAGTAAFGGPDVDRDTLFDPGRRPPTGPHMPAKSIRTDHTREYRSGRNSSRSSVHIGVDDCDWGAFGLDTRCARSSKGAQNPKRPYLHTNPLRCSRLPHLPR
jgi:hypothetical protein